SSVSRQAPGPRLATWQPERLLRDQRAKHLRRPRRNRHRAGVQVALLPLAAIDGARLADAELGVRALQLQRQLAGPLLDLATEELLERGVRTRVLAGVELRKEAERMGPEGLRLDPCLRHLVAERAQVRAAARAAVTHRAIEVGEGERPVLEPDLEVEG